MTSGTVDIYNPKVIRSTMGAMYRMKYAYTDNLKEAAAFLKSRGITTYLCLHIFKVRLIM